MCALYHATSISAFQTFVPGSNIPAQKLRKLENFGDYDARGNRHEMYASLVRLTSP